MTRTEQDALLRWQAYLSTRRAYKIEVDAEQLLMLTPDVTAPSDGYIMRMLYAYTDKFPFAPVSDLGFLARTARSRKEVKTDCR